MKSADGSGTESGEGTDAGSDGAENGEIAKSDNDNAESEPDSGESTGIADELPEDGTYTSRDEVALHLKADWGQEGEAFRGNPGKPD